MDTLVPKPTIAWDVDDVLNDLMTRWLSDCWQPGHPECSLTIDKLHYNPPHELLGTSLPAYLRSLDDYRLSGAYPSLEPRPEVMAWFSSRGAHFHHLAVTSVPAQCAHVSAEWVVRHFGAWIRSFNVVPSPRNEPEMSPRESKAEFLKRFRQVDLLVDDHPEHVSQARRAGLPALLFPRPWNDASYEVADLLDEIDSLLTGNSGDCQLGDFPDRVELANARGLKA